MAAVSVFNSRDIQDRINTDVDRVFGRRIWLLTFNYWHVRRGISLATLVSIVIESACYQTSGDRAFPVSAAYV